MKKTPFGREFTDAYVNTVTAAATVELAKVWPMPGSVILEVPALDGELTPTLARELAAGLIKAAEDAEHLRHPEDSEEEAVLDDRTSEHAEGQQ